MAEGELDPVVARIVEAVELAGSDGDAARRRFDELWDAVGPGGDPLHRCVLAHHAADVQAGVEAELMWDLRALAAANEITDERAHRYHGSPGVAGFYPSLHLNVADAYRRSGDRERARRHLRRAQGAAATLADDGYGPLIRAGIVRLAERLGDDGVVDGDAGVGGPA